MPYTVDFDTVSTVGVESSPVATALAGLRANEARYFKVKVGLDQQHGIEYPPERGGAFDRTVGHLALSLLLFRSQWMTKPGPGHHHPPVRRLGKPT